MPKRESFFMVRPSDSIIFDLVLFDQALQFVPRIGYWPDLSGPNSLNELNRGPSIKGFVRLL